MSVRGRSDEEMRKIMRRPRPAPPAPIKWSGRSAYVDDKICTIQRVAPFVWEVRIDNVVHGTHLTRSQARQWAIDYVRGKVPSTEAEGTKSCR